MLTEPIIAEVTAKHAAAGWGLRGELIRNEARRLHCSAATVYAAVRKFRGRTRHPRADKGKLKKFDPAALQAVAEIKAKASEAERHRRLPTDVAIEMAENNGLIPAGAVSRGAFDRHARRAALFTPERIYARYQARKSNQLHHVDSTQSKYLHPLADHDDGDYLLAVRPPQYSR